MIDHVSIGTRDLQRALDFYTACLAPLGYTVQHQDPALAVFGADGNWSFIAYPAQDDSPLQGHRAHIAFSAPSKEAAQAFHAKAIELGAQTLREPGLRPDVNERYYGAIISDPDQHMIEVVHWMS